MKSASMSSAVSRTTLPGGASFASVKAVVDGRGDRNTSVLGDVADVVEEPLRILRDIGFVDRSVVQSPNDAPSENEQRVHGGVVAVGDGDGVLDGGGRLVAAVDRRENGVDGKRLAGVHTRQWVFRHKKATPPNAASIRPKDTQIPSAVLRSIAFGTHANEAIQLARTNSLPEQGRLSDRERNPSICSIRSWSPPTAPSVKRAVDVALDLADRFEADVHALSVIDASEVDASPQQLRDEPHRPSRPPMMRSPRSRGARRGSSDDRDPRGPPRHRDLRVRSRGRCRRGRDRDPRSPRREPPPARQRRRADRPTSPVPVLTVRQFEPTGNDDDAAGEGKPPTPNLSSGSHLSPSHDTGGYFPAGHAARTMYDELIQSGDLSLPEIGTAGNRLLPADTLEEDLEDQQTAARTRGCRGRALLRTRTPTGWPASRSSGRPTATCRTCRNPTRMRPKMMTTGTSRNRSPTRRTTPTNRTLSSRRPTPREPLEEPGTDAPRSRAHPSEPHNIEDALARVAEFGDEGDRYLRLRPRARPLRVRRNGARRGTRDRRQRRVVRPPPVGRRRGAGGPVTPASTSWSATPTRSAAPTWSTARSSNDFSPLYEELAAVTGTTTSGCARPAQRRPRDYAYWTDPAEYVEVVREYGVDLPEWVTDYTRRAPRREGGAHRSGGRPCGTSRNRRLHGRDHLRPLFTKRGRRDDARAGSRRLGDRQTRRLGLHSGHRRVRTVPRGRGEGQRRRPPLRPRAASPTSTTICSTTRTTGRPAVP